MEARVVAIIQARTGSSRLPGKVLADLNGAPVLQRVIDRTQRATRVDAVWVATTAHDEDDVIEKIALARGAGCYRNARHDDVFGAGKNDVLRRFLGAARAASADVVVRITADCPLISPEVLDLAVAALSPEYDLVSNAIQRSYPRGLDVEVAWIDVLYRLARLATSQPSQEHVFTFAYLEHPALFRIRHQRAGRDDTDINWCVDHQADLERLRAIYDDTVDYRTLVDRIRAGARPWAS